ncbi:Ribonuclease H-like domain containing protein [Melia azedarach]|uniref:Ribonuclease H-like domain containing protein n=1 Tax=Melia azedarach TaxID=155640 RepID=A0ACC1Y6Y8_MELAZ|nr:Ribonuclease H-like domain containing protein [Melia azedarach]
MNVDGVVNLEQGLIGLGAVVRNEKGEVLATATWRHIFPNDVEFVEALTIYEGLKLALSVRLHPLLIESDSKNMVDLILGKSKSFYEIRWLNSKIQAVTNVVRCLVQFVPKACNMVADRLTKLALLYPDNCVWLEEAPLELDSLLYTDVVSYC